MTREQFLSLAGDREVALAQEAPGNLVEQLVRSGEELVDVLRPLSPGDHDRAAWHYARVFTIGTLLAFRTYELGFTGPSRTSDRQEKRLTWLQTVRFGPVLIADTIFYPGKPSVIDTGLVGRSPQGRPPNTRRC